MDKGLFDELEALLRGVYDDDDFVFGTIACLKTDGCARKMIGFFEVADHVGDIVTHDDVIAMSMILKDERVMGEAMYRR